MKNIRIFMLLYFIIFLSSGQPYEARIEPPADMAIFIYRKINEPEKTLIPPRRKVPDECRSIFEYAIGLFNVPPGVLESIAFVESGFDPLALSPIRESGFQDMGMFQFNSKYLRWYADTYNGGKAFDPMFPKEAVIVAAKHIRFLYDYYGHWPTVCLAYNAGMTAVDKNEISDCSFRYLSKIYEE